MATRQASAASRCTRDRGARTCTAHAPLQGVSCPEDHDGSCNRRDGRGAARQVQGTRTGTCCVERAVRGGLRRNLTHHLVGVLDSHELVPVADNLHRLKSRLDRPLALSAQGCGRPSLIIQRGESLLVVVVIKPEGLARRIRGTLFVI